MECCINVPITKKWIEQHATQEQLFYRYLNIIPTTKMFKSPFRSENNSSCHFCKSHNGELLLYDFGGVKHSYTWVNVIMEIYNVDYYKALRIAAEDLNLVTGNTTNKEKREVKELINIPEVKTEEKSLRVKIKNYTQEELNWWMSYGITEKTLKKYDVYSLELVFVGEKVVSRSKPENPIFGYFIRKSEDKEIWKIYSPLSAKFRFLSNTKRSIIQGARQLPKTGSYCVITKSMKDVMLLSQFDIPSVAPNSETTFMTESAIEKFKKRYSTIIVLYDNDYPGIHAMNQLKKKYPDFIYCYIPRNKAKDISDFYKKYGYDETKRFLDSAFEKISNKIYDF